MGIAGAGKALLWPERCLLCGRVVAAGEDCCRACLKGLLLRDTQTRMGFPVTAAWPYRAAWQAVRRFKYGGDLDTGRKLARRMAWVWRRQGRFVPDGVLYVPMAEDRLRERGFNQAELLARWAAAELELPVWDLLCRGGEVTQHHLSASARRQSARVTFAVVPGGEERLAGKKVLLVDDVVTTGSTAASCAILLRDAGARVEILAAAR